MINIENGNPLYAPNASLGDRVSIPVHVAQKKSPPSITNEDNSREIAAWLQDLLIPNQWITVSFQEIKDQTNKN